MIDIDKSGITVAETKLKINKFLQNEIDRIYKKLLDQLFNLNTLLCGTFLVLFQLDFISAQDKSIIILPFFTVLIILIYQLVGVIILGKAKNSLENWKNNDYKILKKNYSNNNFVILTAIILTIIEFGYLLYLFLK